ncbi:MAG: NAD-dependent epimerase/dehydratase family protein, partial [Deltaproteobacteria bacterium]|nr:NAD-dependent epimerase/dehydratase family protein [Deltaproteobacteria bacterium]
GFDEARTTIENNIRSTFNVAWVMLEHAPRCHLIKLGTMGEYGTPNIDIEEGWIDVSHRGRTQRFLYPRQGGSLYHTTKIMDTDLLWFYVRTHGLRVTDLMQGPVYGVSTDESAMDPQLGINFYYDNIFGTVVNRFIAQAVAGIPLTVYGAGKQIRGFINIRDTIQCVKLAAATPAEPHELRVLNLFTEVFSLNEVAAKVKAAAKRVGLEVSFRHVANPRDEAEEHYYKPANDGLLRLGLKPHLMTEQALVGMMEMVRPHQHRIDHSKIVPRVRWDRATAGKDGAGEEGD